MLLLNCSIHEDLSFFAYKSPGNTKMRMGRPNNYSCLKLSTTKPQKAQDKTSTRIAQNKEKSNRVRFNPLCNCI